MTLKVDIEKHSGGWERVWIKAPTGEKICIDIVATNPHKLRTVVSGDTSIKVRKVPAGEMMDYDKTKEFNQ